jgi:hypothetical protein
MVTSLAQPAALHVAESMCPVQPLLQEHVIVSLVCECYSHAAVMLGNVTGIDPAGGGKGAAIGAGAESEIITKGDQVKVPSETLIEFILQQDCIDTDPPELVSCRVTKETQANHGLVQQPCEDPPAQP